MEDEEKVKILHEKKGWAEKWLSSLPSNELNNIYEVHILGREKKEQKVTSEFWDKVKNGKRINLEDVKAHKEKYPTFDDQRMIDWLNKRPMRWRYYDTVAEANKSRQKERSMETLAMSD